MTSVIFLIVGAVLLLSGVRSQGVKGAHSTHDGVKRFSDFDDIANLLDLLNGLPSNDPLKHNQIYGTIKAATWKIDAIALQLPENRNNSLSSLKSSASLHFELNRLNELKKSIKERYNQMKKISQDVARAPSSVLRAFVESNVFSGSSSIKFAIFNIFSTYLGYLNEGNVKPLLEHIAGEFKVLDIFNHCTNVPAQKFLYNEYLEMRILATQAFLVNKFSWTVLSIFNGDSFVAQESVFFHELEVRSSIVTSKFHEVILDASRELRTCDPIHWEENTNYLQIIRLVQGYIANEASLDDFHSCSKNCGYYKNKYVSNCYKKDPFCQKDRGFGKIVSCESESSKDDITYCPSTDMTRRYEYFQIDSGSSQKDNFYGRNSTCKSSEVSLQSWIRGFVRCSYCFCLLDDISGKSDRFINLAEVVSDIEQHKVVTGLRFVKVNRVIYLQIQQGQLAPLGLIRKNTTEWKAVEKYAISEQNKGLYYFMLDNEHKSINLDNIEAKNTSYVVTGVKFDATDSHLYLKVRFTKYNFQTGMLIPSPNNSEWISNDWTHKAPVPLTNGNDGPKVSTNSAGDSLPTPKIYDYVEFTHSSKKEDAAQTTLPFFDAQEVGSYSPAPLSGVGLYHRGMDGYGGFLAPKLFAVNVLPFM